jgi:hypothetical protein
MLYRTIDQISYEFKYSEQSTNIMKDKIVKTLK